MDFATIQSHTAVRRFLIVHGLQIAACCLVTYFAACGLPSSLGQLGKVTISILIAILICGPISIKLINPILIWHRRLGAIGSESIDPLCLTKSSADTAADRGWNNLIEQGRQWHALNALRQEIDQKLKTSQHGEVNRLMDAVASAVAAIDAEGKITFANAMMAGICGSETPDQLIGQTLSQALNVHDSTAQLNDPASPLNDAEWSVADGLNSRMLRGQRRPLSENSTDSVWTIRDVTQQRLADSMRERFLTAATHEFRTPLANIRAYAESLDMGHDIDPEARKHFYNVIQSESQRLSQLVDDLLDISRMQAGALSLECNEVDLGRLVQDVTSKVKGQIVEKQLQLRCEFPPKFPKFSADKNMIAAALVNLIGNAAKYTPEGGKITFRVEVNARNVQFIVADSGIGIGEAELSKVFDRFFRSADDRVQTISGSGLGLSLVQEVARLHGGEVLVESVLDQGSTFRMVIPLD